MKTLLPAHPPATRGQKPRRQLGGHKGPAPGPLPGTTALGRNQAISRAVHLADAKGRLLSQARRPGWPRYGCPMRVTCQR